MSTSHSSATRQSKWSEPEESRDTLPWLEFHRFSFNRAIQICLQGWVWKVQALHDDNPDVWSNYLPLFPQLPVRKRFLLRAHCFGFCGTAQVIFCFSIFLLFRVTDEIFNFLLVWYYCTLTIRESILMSNGSRCGPNPFLSFLTVQLFESIALIFKVLQVIASHHLNFFPMLFLWSPQDQRLVGVSSLCLHLSVRCDAHLVSYNLSNKAVLVNDSCWRKTVKTSFTELFLCSIVCFFFQLCLCRPEGPMYQKFRSQFLAFSIYQSKDLTSLSGRLELDFKGTVWFELLKKKKITSITWSYVERHVFPSAASLPGFVQFLQYYYQSGCLYRLRALGERNQLDLTVGAFAGILTVAPSAAVSLSGTINGAKVKIRVVSLHHSSSADVGRNLPDWQQ